MDKRDFSRILLLDPADTPHTNAVALTTYDTIVPRFYSASNAVLERLCTVEPIPYSAWDYLAKQTGEMYRSAMAARELCLRYYDELKRRETHGWARAWHARFPARIRAQQRAQWDLTLAVDHMLNLISGVHNAVEHHGFVDRPEHHIAVMLRIEIESLQDALFGR